MFLYFCLWRRILRSLSGSSILGKIDILASELTKLYRRDSLFCILIRLLAGRSGVRFTTGGEIFFSFISKTFAPAVGPTQTLTNGLWMCNFTSHLHLVPSLRKRGALPLLSPPLYVFVACTRTTLYFTRETHPVNLALKHHRY